MARTYRPYREKSNDIKIPWGTYPCLCSLTLAFSQVQHAGASTEVLLCYQHGRNTEPTCSLSAEALAITQGNTLAAWNIPNLHSVPLPFHRIWEGNSIHCNSSSGVSLGDTSHLSVQLSATEKQVSLLSFPPLETTKTPHCWADLSALYFQIWK